MKTFIKVLAICAIIGILGISFWDILAGVIVAPIVATLLLPAAVVVLAIVLICRLIK